MARLLVLSFVLLLGSLTASAQYGWEAGGWAGVSYYFGDLNTNFRLNRPALAGGINARYNFNKRLCMKLAASYGQVSADDAESENIFERARNLNFQSDIIDGTAQFEFNFFTYTHGSKDEFYTPYLFAGLSVFHFNPQTEFGGELVDLRPLGTEGQFKGEEYSQVSAALAYGAGMKIDLSYRWSINVEISARRLMTDYLDDVSTVYPDLDDLARARGDDAAALSDRSILIEGVNDTSIGEPGRQRGNSEDNDSFVFVGVSFMYYFGDLRCPPYSQR